MRGGSRKRNNVEGMYLARIKTGQIRRREKVSEREMVLVMKCLTSTAGVIAMHKVMKETVRLGTSTIRQF